MQLVGKKNMGCCVGFQISIQNFFFLGKEAKKIIIDFSFEQNLNLLNLNDKVLSKLNYC